MVVMVVSRVIGTILGTGYGLASWGRAGRHRKEGLPPVGKWVDI